MREARERAARSGLEVDWKLCENRRRLFEKENRKAKRRFSEEDRGAPVKNTREQDSRRSEKGQEKERRKAKRHNLQQQGALVRRVHKIRGGIT